MAEITRRMFLCQQTFATLLSVSNKLQAKGDEGLEYLTSRQLMTIIAIAHIPKGKASLNRLAKKMGTTKQNMKQIVEAMRKKGYVNVVPSETNRRAYSVEVNNEKMNEIHKCYMDGTNFLENVFNEFTENELEIIWGMLKKLYSYDGEAQDGFEEPVKIN